MQKILILTNSINGLYSFRRELIEELLQNSLNVTISAPNDTRTNYFKDIGCNMIETNISRRGTNPISDSKLLINYLRSIKKYKPDVVLTYTIKPNVYGGIACRLTNTPQIANITGLGTAIENKGILQKISLGLYRIGLKKSKCVFFQNKENMQFMQANGIGVVNSILIPGSGVNLSQHNAETYPSEENILKFLFIGRLMKAKGIEELFSAIEILKPRFPGVEFHFVGGKEENYDSVIDGLVEKKAIIYHGRQNDVHEFIKNSHALINPSHHEGMSNVLLEAASTARPIIASDIPGCRETFNEGVTGLGFKVKNVDSLINVIEKFIKLPHDKKAKMGLLARKKMEQEYDRRLVIDAYLEQIGI